MALATRVASQSVRLGVGVGVGASTSAPKLVQELLCSSSSSSAAAALLRNNAQRGGTLALAFTYAKGFSVLRPLEERQGRETREGGRGRGDSFSAASASSAALTQTAGELELEKVKKKESSAKGLQDKPAKKKARPAARKSRLRKIAPITLTESAAERIRMLLGKRSKAYLRLGVRTRGW